MVAHSHVVVEALIAERHETFRREVAEDRLGRLARLYARLARRPTLLTDGSLVAEWVVQASSHDLESAA